MNEEASQCSDRLLDAVRNGDEEASDRLVELLYPQVQRIVRGHVRNVADHEDIMQEVFMKIFLKIDQFEGRQPIEHWVSRLAVRTCYDWLRKRRVRPLMSYADFSENEAEVIERSLGGDLGGEQGLQREILTGLLDKLLGFLNAREQIVIRLVDLEERSIKEACEITGWSASKIKTTASRARRKLADHLHRLEGRSSP